MRKWLLCKLDLIEQVYREHYDHFVQYAAWKLKTPSRAEDVVHDAFAKVLLPLRNPRAMEKMRGFIFNWLRKSIERANLEDDRIEYYDDSPNSNGTEL